MESINTLKIIALHDKQVIDINNNKKREKKEKISVPDIDYERINVHNKHNCSLNSFGKRLNTTKTKNNMAHHYKIDMK